MADLKAVTMEMAIGIDTVRANDGHSGKRPMRSQLIGAAERAEYAAAELAAQVLEHLAQDLREDASAGYHALEPQLEPATQDALARVSEALELARKAQDALRAARYAVSDVGEYRSAAKLREALQ